MPQGFYVWSNTRNVWLPCVLVPLGFTLTNRGKPMAILLRDFMYVDAMGRRHVAMRGMPFDGLTLGRPLWIVAGPPYGKYLKGGVIHDHYCFKAGSIPPGPERDAIRRSGDRLFGEMCAYIEGHDGLGPAVFGRGVRIGAYWQRFVKPEPEPDYEHDLVKAYARLGISHCADTILGNREGV